MAYLEVWARWENLAESGPLATVGGPLANTQKKLENDGESGCGWLYWKVRWMENYPKNTKNN